MLNIYLNSDLIITIQLIEIELRETHFKFLDEFIIENLFYETKWYLNKAKYYKIYSVPQLKKTNLNNEMVRYIGACIDMYSYGKI